MLTDTNEGSGTNDCSEFTILGMYFEKMKAPPAPCLPSDQESLLLILGQQSQQMSASVHRGLAVMEKTRAPWQYVCDVWSMDGVLGLSPALQQ